MTVAVAFASGERCYLRALQTEDLKGPWRNWLNDPIVTRHMLRGDFPTVTEDNAGFYHDMSASENDLVLAIVHRANDKHVGNIGLHRIDWVHRVAEFGILIGDRDAWGKGIGTEATRLICRHGFDRLNLHRIWLGVMGDHAAAIQCYKRVGFKLEGLCRQEIARGGVRVDKLIMGLLYGELTEP